MKTEGRTIPEVAIRLAEAYTDAHYALSQLFDAIDEAASCDNPADIEEIVWHLSYCGPSINLNHRGR